MAPKIHDNMEISRILPFEYAVEFFEGKISFSHPSLWEDPYEKIYPFENTKKLLFAQCWCLTGYSDAMWRIFSNEKNSRKNGPGIQIRSTIGKFKSELKKCQFRYKIKIYSDAIDYLPTNKIQNLINDTDNLDLIFKKRTPFKHEKEYRFVIEADSENDNIDKTHRRINIELSSDPRDIIQKIVIDPWASPKLVDAIQKYFHNVLHIKSSCKKSTLYKETGNKDRK